MGAEQIRRMIKDADAKRLAAKNAPDTMNAKYMKPPEKMELSKENTQTMGDVSQRFAGLKQSAANRVGAGLGGNMDAIKRRFASMGASGSGAQVKAEQMAHEQAARVKEDTIAGIDAQEQGALDSAAGRGLQHNLSQADLDFRSKVFALEKGSKLWELDMAERQFQQDARTTEFNKTIANRMSRGGGGFLGMG